VVRRVPLLANSFVTVYESPDPSRIYAYTPGIAKTPSGRLIATMDCGGPGVIETPGPVAGSDEKKRIWRGKVFTSDDGGRTWQHRANFPFYHARPFCAGQVLYILGHAGDLAIIRSDDDGNSWSDVAYLTEGQIWHQSACNVLYCRDRVYLVMERKMDPHVKGWPPSVYAPVLMTAVVNDDLTRPEAWRFSNQVAFRDIVPKPFGIGVPFHPIGQLAPGEPDVRNMAPIGWLETNVVQFYDPDHIWHDPTGRTFYLWMRAHTGTTNLACIAKAVEDEAGNLTVGLAQAPSGETVVWVPCPGGHLRFHILYDDVTKLYWLLSSQATDSMIRVDRLPSDRFNLPNNERHRLALYFSKNCVDWLMAGLVAYGDTPKQARHYASMAIDGDDLVILSRSGDSRAKSAHDGNLITFHRVVNFRELVY